MDYKSTESSDAPACNRRSMIGYFSSFLAGSLIFPFAKPAMGRSLPPGKETVYPVFNVMKFGATGKREDNATASFRAAIKACVGNGGGKVMVPPGEYTVGTLELKDNVNLHIMAGATLFLSQSRQDFQRGSRAMIYAENAKNISVTGKGTLDGLAQYVYTEMEGVDPEIAQEIAIAREAGEDMRRYYRKPSAMNTYMFILNDCQNVTLQDVRIINSPLWNVRLNDCDRVHVSGVYIHSSLEKGVNADGIDICSCSNVMISDSLIVTGDDAIILKSISRNGKSANPCRNITVTNCVLESSSTALGIGTETEADISHVLFNNCVIRNSNKGIGINVQDGAIVSDVIFSNLTIELNRRHWNWWGSAETCRFILRKRTPNARLGAIKNILVDNIIAHPRGTSTIIGHPEQPLENITLRNVQLKMRPEDAKDKRATDALQIEHVRNLKIQNLTVDWTVQQTEKKWRSALVLKNISQLKIDSFSGRQGLMSGNAPVIDLENVNDAIVRNSDVPEGAHAFLHVSGEKSQEIVLRNNYLKKADQVITYENRDLQKSVDLK